MENIKDEKCRITLTYNPYEREIILSDGINYYDHNNGLSDKPFDKLLNEAIEYFDDSSQNKNEIHCIFEGRSYEFNITKLEIKAFYKDSHKKISFEHKCKYEYNIKEIERQIKQLPEDFFPDNSKKEVILEQLNSNLQMYIIGLYSSGKSTFINAMIGDSLLYSHDDIATNKLHRIIDNDQDIIRIKTFNKTEQISEKIHKDIASAAITLEQDNKEKDVDTVYIEVDIPNIDSRNYKLELIDMPGVNNADNKSHKKIAYDAINDIENLPPVILVINPGNFRSDDQDNLLETIKDIQGKDNQINLERFFFIINRADLIKFKEYENIYEEIKNMIKNKLGDGAKIYSTNSEYTVLIRKKLNNLNEFNLDINRFIEDIQFGRVNYLPKYSTRKTYEEVPIINKDDSGKINLQKALLYTGIPMLEKDIQEYLENHAIVQKLEYTFKKLNEIKDFYQSKLNEDNSSISEIASTILNLESNKKTISEQISSIALAIKKLEKQRDVNANNKKALEKFVNNMNPSIKKYEDDINNLKLDDIKFNELQRNWSNYIDGLITYEKDKTYKNDQHITLRIKRIAYDMDTKKAEIDSKANADIRKGLREEANLIIKNFHKVIDANIEHLGTAGKDFKNRVKIYLNDYETLFRADIKQTTKKYSLSDYLIFSRMMKDTKCIDLESLNKEYINFQNTQNNIKLQSEIQLTNLKVRSALNIQKLKEIISKKEAKLISLDKKLQKSIENLEKFEKDLKNGVENSSAHEDEYKKSRREILQLKVKITEGEKKIKDIANILNSKNSK